MEIGRLWINGEMIKDPALVGQAFAEGFAHNGRYIRPLHVVDRNGVYVNEGDLLAMTNSKGECGIYRIVWHQQVTCQTEMMPNGKLPPNQFSYEYIRPVTTFEYLKYKNGVVIGNIWENEELMHSRVETEKPTREVALETLACRHPFFPIQDYLKMNFALDFDKFQVNDRKASTINLSRTISFPDELKDLLIPVEPWTSYQQISRSASVSAITRVFKNTSTGYTVTSIQSQVRSVMYHSITFEC